jgi:L-methionine (R)-S-oxide reductase
MIHQTTKCGALQFLSHFLGALFYLGEQGLLPLPPQTMAETIFVQGTTKAERYAALMPQLAALTETETDWIANVSNVVAALRQTFGFFWVGLYIVKPVGEGRELVLGPFQGPIACTRIALGRGVCGAAWAQKKTVLVPDVEQFPGHIACSSESKSEIVIPGLSTDGQVIFVLDVDSDQLNYFDESDQRGLEEVVGLLEMLYRKAHG